MKFLSFDSITNPINFAEMNEESKMRIRLSEFAKSTIQSDKSAFQGLGYESCSKGRLYNEIFRRMRYYYESVEGEEDCSFPFSFIRSKYDELEEYIKYNDKTAKAFEYVISKEKERLERSVAELLIKDDGECETITINAENCKYLTDECEEATCYGEYNFRRFFECVLESYARKGYIQRERIMNYSRIETIEKAIENKRILKVTLRSGDQAGQSVYMVKPFKILANPMNTFLYLVGVSAKQGEDDEKIASFRISRISDIKETKRASFLSRDDVNDIKEKIKSNGVMYLITDTVEIEVILDEIGTALYKTIIHNRPKYDKLPEKLSDGRYLYKFSCTELHIKNYFFQFGAHAEIKSPELLRKAFANEYREAVARYEMDSRRQ